MDDHDYFGASSDKLQVNFWQKAALWFMGLMLFTLLAVSIKKKEETKRGDVTSVADMTVDIEWPGCKKYEQSGEFPVCMERIDIDIDLWVKSPDDERPVGYSNRAGKTFNLTRDDLGITNDVTDRNTETASTRGLPAGEYIVNIHYFLSHEPGDAPEVPVNVVISTKTAGVGKATSGMKQIITRKAVLRVQGEEITVVRFVIKENGELDKESINDFYQELRSWQPPTQ